jgi:hypothetical protein
VTNIFLLYRPFHYSYAELIIKNYCVSDENIFINHFSAGVNSKKSADQKDLYIKKGIPEGIFSLRAYARMMRNYARSGQDINIFIPHTLGVLANFAFYTLAKNYKNVKINVFYEGVIVFYNYQHLFRKNAKYYITRVLTSAACGISYRINKRLLNFYDDRICRIYSPFLNIDAPKGKLFKVKLNSVHYEVDSRICLILGLDLGRTMDEEMKKIVRSMYKRILDSHITTVYFKPHPSEKNILFEAVANEMGVILTEINDTRPIEDIINLYKPGYVFSIWSSAIINLKCIVPPEVKIASFVTTKLIESEEHQKIVDRFEEMDIDVLFA